MVSNGKSIALAFELGFEIVIAIGLPLGLGIFLDSKVTVSPFGVLIGAMLGVASALTILFRFGVKKE